MSLYFALANKKESDSADNSIRSNQTQENQSTRSIVARASSAIEDKVVALKRDLQTEKQRASASGASASTNATADAAVVTTVRSDLRVQKSIVGQSLVKLDRLEETQLAGSTRLSTVETEIQQHKAQAVTRMGIKDTEVTSLAELVGGNVLVGGDDPTMLTSGAALTAATITGAAAGSILVNLVWLMERQTEMGRAVHLGWPAGLPAAVTFAKATVTDAEVSAPSAWYAFGVVPTAIGGTVTWGGTAWVLSTAYSLDDVVTNDGNTYVCTTAGTSAGSGGPTGDRPGIVDGTAGWKYLGAGTNVVLMDDTTGVSAALGVSEDADGQWFPVTAVETDVAAVVGNPLGLSLPAGAGASSVGKYPKWDDNGRFSIIVVLDTGAGKDYAAAEYLEATADISAVVKPHDFSDVSAKVQRIVFV